MAHPSARPRSAFSLVELLVVIGLIGVLVALLIPALSAARTRGESLQCLANLRTIGMAAHLHANVHRGYIPVAGLHWGAELEPPGGESIRDPEVRRYTYYSDEGVQRPVPFSAAIAVSLGVPVRLDSRENLEADLQTEPVRKHFRCPSQTVEMQGLTQSIGRWRAPYEWSSYVMNDDLTGTARDKPELPQGKLSKVRRPSVVMLAMDGKPRYPPGEELNWLFIPALGNKDGTVLDYRKASLDPSNDFLGREALDYLRHNWKANVLFLDGHVETVPMTDAGLATIGTTRGIYQ